MHGTRSPRSGGPWPGRTEEHSWALRKGGGVRVLSELYGHLALPGPGLPVSTPWLDTLGTDAHVEAGEDLALLLRLGRHAVPQAGHPRAPQCGRRGSESSALSFRWWIWFSSDDDR